MARMNADEYNSYSMKSVKSISQGDTMKYQNKTIFKSPKGNTWYTRYRIEGKQYYISGKTQQDTYNKLKQALQSSKKQLAFRYTLKKWIETWYKMYKGNLRARSIIDYHNITDKIPTTLLNRELKKFTSIELSYYLESIKSARMRAKTYTVLNDIFDKALKNSLIEKNPFSIINKPKYKPGEKYSLSLSEENKLYEKIKNNEEYFIYGIAMLQGLRPGELLALEYRDVDFNNMTITINKAYDEVTDDIDVKNEYSNRTIPLFNKTYELIKSIDTTSSTRFAKHYVNTLNDKLKELVKDITDEKITLYNLRHTFITRLGDQNVPEHLIQAWAGHSKGSKITKSVYTHVSKETENKYINILNNAKN